MLSMRTPEPAQLFTEELPPTHEAAVLFAAGFADAALELVRAEVARSGDKRAFLMLLDLCHVTGRREEFDALFDEVRQRFGDEAHPGWGYPTPVETPGSYAMAGHLSAKQTDLQRLAAHVGPRKAAAVDLGEVERIDFEFAGSFVALMRSCHAAGKRVILANVNELNAALLEAFGANRYTLLIRNNHSPLRLAA